MIMSFDPMPKGTGAMWFLVMIALYYIYKYGKKSYRNIKERQSNKLVDIDE